MKKSLFKKKAIVLKKKKHTHKRKQQPGVVTHTFHSSYAV
jgi:hypothetical protein